MKIPDLTRRPGRRLTAKSLTRNRTCGKGCSCRDCTRKSAQCDCPDCSRHKCTCKSINDPDCPDCCSRKAAEFEELQERFEESGGFDQAAFDRMGQAYGIYTPGSCEGGQCLLDL